MINRIRNFFAEKQKSNTKFKPNLTEVALSESGLYGAGDFSKWNPDILLSRKGPDIYKRMMQDDQIKAVMQFKIDSVINRGYYFDIDSKNKDHEEIAAFFKLVLDQIQGNFIDKLSAILSALPFGFSIVEKIYMPIEYEGKTYWGIKNLKLRPFDSFNGGIKVDQYDNITELRQNIIDVKIPMDKVIYFVHNPIYDEHYGESDLRAAYRSYWSKDIIIKLQNMHLERHAGGFIWASIDGNLSITQSNNVKDLISNVSGAMGAMLPKNVELKQFNPMNTDAFERAIAQHDKAIAKSVLVPNLLGLTEQGATGSYAQSQTHEQAFLNILSTIDSRVAEVLNEQLFRQLCIWNFGHSNFPRYKFNKLTKAQQVELLKAWGELIGKGAVTKSDSDESHIRMLLDFPEKEEPEKVEKMPIPITPEDIGNPSDNESEPSEEETRDYGLHKPSKNEFIEDKKIKLSPIPWLNRVDFAKIKKDLNEADEKHVGQLNDIMGQVKLSLQKQIANIVGQRSLGNVKPNEFNTIVIPKKFISGLKTVMRENLQEVIDTQYEQAKTEVPKKEFKKTIPSGMDKTQIERFFKNKNNFFVTGVLQQDVLNATLQVLQNGIKYDKTLKDTIQALDEDTTLVSVLPNTDAAGRPVNVPLRLENIVRTNTGDAVNQARQALFTSPEMQGFVIAFEYSAIIDDRTSGICEDLNGKIKKDWNNYTPPNHYQCRSILVPINIFDGWSGKEDNIPASTKPLKGFG